MRVMTPFSSYQSICLPKQGLDSARLQSAGREADRLAIRCLTQSGAQNARNPRFGGLLTRLHQRARKHWLNIGLAAGAAAGVAHSQMNSQRLGVLEQQDISRKVQMDILRSRITLDELPEVGKAARRGTLQIIGTHPMTGARVPCGAGVILNVINSAGQPDVVLLTNRHVVAMDESRGRPVLVKTVDGDKFQATVATLSDGRSAEKPILTWDLVALSFPEEIRERLMSNALNLMPPERIEQNLHVVASGSPFGVESTTFGTLSGMMPAGAPIPPSAYPARYLMTDAAVNPGNSGGPLTVVKKGMNAEGRPVYRAQVIGINQRLRGSTPMQPVENTAYAISSEAIAAVLSDWGYRLPGFAMDPEKTAAAVREVDRQYEELGKGLAFLVEQVCDPKALEAMLQKANATMPQFVDDMIRPDFLLQRTVKALDEHVATVPKLEPIDTGNQEQIEALKPQIVEILMNNGFSHLLKPEFKPRRIPHGLFFPAPIKAPQDDGKPATDPSGQK